LFEGSLKPEAAATANGLAHRLRWHRAKRPLDSALTKHSERFTAWQSGLADETSL
jgi:hypothetical protein